ncbi:MAG: carboxylesterase family protein [Ruminococcus sp.]|uniref:carboxylesterase/lipase family protein n=1 Tax=Ruminococcus sp. TaxID=41978 RepID=UPI002873806A|nr:carboxylesterase family protein [Ruminococcus sp.]MBQ3285447.1 carboxylesterase family protein [Ruminococcus sp.]MBQ3286268.1 carboxylesterase family protein [Ruminococcus sp.]
METNRVRDSYGINQIITGEYDAALSATCGNGVFVGKSDGDILAFRGIPFAKPPVGALRWKAPEAVEDGTGVFEAYFNGKSPIQTEWRSEQASFYPQSEDCLYLNLWKNQADSTEKKPVMVFFHGGSYGWGGTADPLYDGRNFVTKQPDIILVTVGYRTGLMGFVDLSYLEGGEEYPDAPNLGILDQIEALRWIQKNIAAFGGDPDNVTVFGESAGGGSVSLLPMLPRAKGLFRRAIAESGSVALTFSKEECRDFTRRLIREARTNRMSDLMAMSEGKLKAINEKLNEYNNFPQRDGRLIPAFPYVPYEQGVTKDVDIMIGTNAEEMNYWVGEIGGVIPFRFSIPVKYENDMKTLSPDDRKRVKRFMSAMKGHSMWRMARFYDEMMFRLPAIAQAQAHAKNGGKAYMYYWTIPSAIPLRKACHAVELAYVFGNREETIYTGQVADERISDTVMQMWTNFARTGDPSIEGLNWEPYDEEKRATMILSEKPHMQDDPLGGRRKLLFPLLRRMINPSYADLDYNVPFVRKAIAGGVALVAGASYLAYKLIKKK